MKFSRALICAGPQLHYSRRDGSRAHAYLNMANDKRKGGSRRLKMVGPPADAQELQPDPSETFGSGNVKKILPDPDAAAKRDAEKYRLLQAAAQVELCRRAIGREPDVSDWERWVKSGDPPIDPFAVLSNEQIEQVLRAAQGVGHASP
jgi:hypothetical protein